MKLPTTSFQSQLNWLLGITLIVSAAFTSFPQVDIYISSLFYRDGFWLAEVQALDNIRLWLIWFMEAFALGTLAVFIVALLRKRPAKKLGYAVSVMLAGPLLLVNAILKTYWGRARPEDVAIFGGDKEFTSAYLFTDQCSTNCSFTSGEAGSIATVAALIAFFAWPNLGRIGRLWLGASMVGLTIVGAGLRVATGRHFMSDALLSILFCGLVAAGLYRLFYPAKAA